MRSFIRTVRTQALTSIVERGAMFWEAAELGASSWFVVEVCSDDEKAVERWAATGVKEAIEETKVRLGGEFGAKDIKDLAEIFTLSSKYWSLVRPGVVCTKLPQQAGACNKQVGMPETSRCRTQCDFRLEQAALRDDVDRSIEQAFQFLEEAVLERDEISAEMWRGQVYTNIDRFPSLRQKWETKLAEFQQLPTFASVP